LSSVSVPDAHSPPPSVLLASGPSPTSQLELHSALASPCSSPAARRPRLSSNCTQLSNCILTQLAVGRLGLARLERDVAVHTLQASVSRREDEGGTPGANEGLAVRARGLGGPGGRNPRRVAARAYDRLGLEGEVADARPDIAPLLALDVGEAMHGHGPGAEGHGIVGEHAAPGVEVTSSAGLPRLISRP